MQVSVENETVLVQRKTLEAHGTELIQELESLAKTLPGVKEVRIKVLPVVP